MFDPSKAPLVTETLLKKRRSLEELALVRQETVKKDVKRRRVVRGENIKIKRPEQFVIERRVRDNSEKKFQRKASSVSTKKEKARVIPTVGFAVRVLSGTKTSSFVKEGLSNLGLKNKYEGVFVSLKEEDLVSLKPFEDYIAYGYVSMKMVEELIHRRAYVMDQGVKKPLSDNVLVEKLLGESYNIICLNDLVHEIYQVGENFPRASEILAPFRLSAPAGNFEKKQLHIAADKRGFLGQEMEDFLLKMF